MASEWLLVGPVGSAKLTILAVSLLVEIKWCRAAKNGPAHFEGIVKFGPAQYGTLCGNLAPYTNHTYRTCEMNKVSNLPN